MLSPELRLALTGGANAALTEEATPDRWAAVLDAIAFSPVRTEVAPVSQPAVPSDELLTVIKKYASRVPKVAIAFGIEASKPARPTGRALRPPKPPKRSGVVPVPPRPEVTGLAAPAPSPAPAGVVAVAEVEPVIEAAPIPAAEDERVAEPVAEATDAMPAPDDVAPAEPETPSTEREDDLPGPADAEAPESLEATDAYAEVPAPEVAAAAIDEAVEAAAEEPTPTDG
jgi:hypothetical protein